MVDYAISQIKGPAMNEIGDRYYDKRTINTDIGTLRKYLDQGFIEILRDLADVVETFHDFGPSTKCPDCGSDNQVLHWYTLGRKDAAKRIRKIICDV